MLIDTHCHLEMKEFDLDRREVIERMTDSLVAACINVGESLAGSRKSVKIAQDWVKLVYASVGVHPHNVREVNKETLSELLELGKNREVVAVGEIGLDYYRRPLALPISADEKEKQKMAFREQLHLAAELNLPLIIHSRDAYEDTAKILYDFKQEMKGKYEVRGVVHSWSGSIEQARLFLDLGFMIGFTGNITYPNIPKKVEQAIIDLPLNRILVETDAPFLPPQVHRGTRNEPSYVWEVAAHIAAKKGIPREDVERHTTDNAKLLFKIE